METFQKATALKQNWFMRHKYAVSIATTLVVLMVYTLIFGIIFPEMYQDTQELFGNRYPLYVILSGIEVLLFGLPFFLLGMWYYEYQSLRAMQKLMQTMVGGQK